MKEMFYDKRYQILMVVVMIALINVYVFVIVPSDLSLYDSLYLNLILVVVIFIFGLLDYQYTKKLMIQTETNEISENKGAITQTINLLKMENNSNIKDFMATQLETSEYIIKWSHELKVPLATLKMMIERSNDEGIRKDAFIQIERLTQSLNQMLFLSKLQNPSTDVVKERVDLRLILNQTIRNNAPQFIRKLVDVNISENTEWVLSDVKWLGYIFDQIIANSLKYIDPKVKPELNISLNKTAHAVQCVIADNGLGIDIYDFDHLFEKGFVGHKSRENGYVSTGMGIYFVKKAVDLLGHEINISSNDQGGTTVTLTFTNLDSFLHLEM